MVGVRRPLREIARGLFPAAGLARPPTGEPQIASVRWGAAPPAAEAVAIFCHISLVEWNGDSRAKQVDPPNPNYSLVALGC
jgi:hypothetical protein